MMRSLLPLCCAAGLLALSPSGLAAEPEKAEDGKYYNSEGEPIYMVASDGTVDWFTYSGFRRYHSECHVCHGPDGMGSSFGPALTQTLKAMSYEQFLEIVVNGRENVTTSQQSKMPAFGENRNVMCYIDDLYVYLKARADNAIGRGRPAKKEPKSDEAKAQEDACMGG